MYDISDKQFELEKHLHEQYSSNSNAHLQIFLTFTATLFVLFGTFGIVFAKTSPLDTEGSLWFNIENFLWLSVVVMGILCFLTCLSVFLGYAERRDQLQLFRIRDKYGLTTVYSTPNNRCLAYYLTGYYRLFFTALLFSQILVIVASLYKISQFVCKCDCCCWRYCDHGYCKCLYIMAFVVYFLCLVITICYVIKYYMNYMRTEARPKDGDKENYQVVDNIINISEEQLADLNRIKKDFSCVIVSNGDFAVYAKFDKKNKQIDLSKRKSIINDKFDIKNGVLSKVGIKPVSRFYYWVEQICACW
ncbi:MAG: hypothetical protein IJU33_10970 [Bacteroidales bacterium]|nr:hypothetical protein [Bacteroidales bacterium]